MNESKLTVEEAKKFSHEELHHMVRIGTISREVYAAAMIGKRRELFVNF